MHLQNLALVASLSLLCGCSGGNIEKISGVSCNVTSIADVYRDPLAHDGKQLCGIVRIPSHDARDGVRFVPEDEQYDRDVAVVPDNISKGASLAFSDKTVRAFISGRLYIHENLKDCFGDAACIPHRKPVFIAVENIIVLQSLSER